jgi:hypothetical protein
LLGAVTDAPGGAALMLDVRIRWSRVSSRDDDERWSWTRVLYAYTVPPRDEIVYIGKADFCTVRERWYRSAKAHVWDSLEDERGKLKHAVLVGDVLLAGGSRLSVELLSDIESLLISRVAPWANRQCISSRIARPGLRVRCEGQWPLATRTFLDQQVADPYDPG